MSHFTAAAKYYLIHYMARHNLLSKLNFLYLEKLSHPPRLTKTHPSEVFKTLSCFLQSTIDDLHTYGLKSHYSQPKKAWWKRFHFIQEISSRSSTGFAKKILAKTLKATSAMRFKASYSQLTLGYLIEIQELILKGGSNYSDWACYAFLMNSRKFISPLLLLLMRMEIC